MDIKQIKGLVQLMVENDLSRIELREGDTHILLRRGYPTISMTPAATIPALAAPHHAPLKAAEAAAPAPAAAEVEHFIRSPMVGTFYGSADPESPPFINVGDAVTPESVVCLVEAMKVFNEIKAEVAGHITKVLVKNAQAVEFDQPLFAVAPA
jgi:acetyl-CoA carboxylase biotin carboxyl carrier protein